MCLSVSQLLCHILAHSTAICFGAPCKFCRKQMRNWHEQKLPFLWDCSALTLCPELICLPFLLSLQLLVHTHTQTVTWLFFTTTTRWLVRMPQGEKVRHTSSVGVVQLMHSLIGFCSIDYMFTQHSGQVLLVNWLFIQKCHLFSWDFAWLTGHKKNRFPLRYDLLCKKTLRSCHTQ